LNTSEEPTFEWYFDPQLDQKLIDDRELFPLGLNSGVLVMAGINGANSLMSGFKYTFSLVCTVKERSGTAALVVDVNRPPSGGSFDVWVAADRDFRLQFRN
jgi:hypothetical protein